MPHRAPRWLHTSPHATPHTNYPSHELPYPSHELLRTTRRTFCDSPSLRAASQRPRARPRAPCSVLLGPADSLSLRGVRTADSARSGSSSPVPRPSRADRVPRPPKTRTIDYVPCYIEYSIDPYFTVARTGHAREKPTTLSPQPDLSQTCLILYVHTVCMYNNDPLRRRGPHTRSYARLRRDGESHTRTQTLESDKDVTQTHSYTRRPAEPGGSAYGVGAVGCSRSGVARG